jgi:UMF1 family MFS transporter
VATADAPTVRATAEGSDRFALSAADQRRNRSAIGVASWALYDLANTIYSFNVVSYALPLWVLAVYSRLGLGDGEANFALGAATALSMLLNAAVSPVMGAVSDRAGVRKPFLFVFTVACILPTAALGLIGDDAGSDVAGTYFWAGLAVFALANFSYQAALIYYDAMLPMVSTPERRGRIGGIGVALGYVGTIIGALSIRQLTFVEGKPSATTFVVTAVLFAFFALPIFLVVRERRGAGARTSRALLRWDFRGSWAQLMTTVRHASQYPGLLRFLVARLLYTDPINTVISFMAVYATKAVGFTEDESLLVLIAVTVAAIIGGFVWGFVVDRIGPKRTLLIVLSLWCLAFIAAAAVLDKVFFLFVGAVAGLALAGTWASDRIFMLRLSPASMVGEFFGLYGLAGKFSAVTGPLIWGITLLVFEPIIGIDAYRLAILAQLILMFAGMAVLRGVSDVPRSDSTDTGAPVAV